MAYPASDLPVFLTSDDPSTVLKELESCPAIHKHSWTLLTLPGGFPKRSFKQESHYRLWAEMTVLIRARWVAVTPSSNIGSIVQLLRTQPPDSLAALDFKYSRIN